MCVQSFYFRVEFNDNKAFFGHQLYYRYCNVDNLINFHTGNHNTSIIGEQKCGFCEPLIPKKTIGASDCYTLFSKTTT